MKIDVVNEDPRWDEAGLEALAERAGAAVARHAGLPPETEAVVLGCDDTRIAALNQAFREKPGPTNVLSWPAEELARGPGEPPAPPKGPELGDIAIAWETCQREAAEQGKSPEDHVTHLLVHGLLHLLGHDHIDERDAALMEAREVEILRDLGIDDPYAAGEPGARPDDDGRMT